MEEQIPTMQLRWLTWTETEEVYLFGKFWHLGTNKRRFEQLQQLFVCFDSEDNIIEVWKPIDSQEFKP